MGLNGIDIASYQQGINLSTVPCDFVIVKATQGTSYTNPDYRRAVDQALTTGKLVGVYHYVSGGNPQAEAEYFTNTVKPYVGNVLLALDWENGQNSAWGQEAYLEALTQQVIAKTGVRPLLYTMQNRYQQVKQVADGLNCGLWIAQYANNERTGYQAHPWNEEAYNCTIRQYSSSGNLPNWGGRLDLNLFYGDATAWLKYANPEAQPQPAPAPAPVDPLAGKTDEQLATEVLQGVYGDGEQRRQALGARYDAVQNLVNQRATVKTDEQLADEVMQGLYGNGEQRRQALGARYDAVQAIINHRAQPRTITVQAGDTLSAIAQRNNTTWQHLQVVNGLVNPNLIYPGQTLRL